MNELVDKIIKHPERVLPTIENLNNGKKDYTNLLQLFDELDEEKEEKLKIKLGEINDALKGTIEGWNGVSSQLSYLIKDDDVKNYSDRIRDITEGRIILLSLDNSTQEDPYPTVFLINIPYIQSLIDRNPEIFSDAKKGGEKEWIINFLKNPPEHQDDNYHLMHGMLSGYPPKAIENHLKNNPSKRHELPGVGYYTGKSEGHETDGYVVAYRKLYRDMNG